MEQEATANTKADDSMSIPAFVYVAPARYEDILKLGFSRDPCDRVRSFHPRYFEYFDLARGMILRAAGEKDARRIEQLLAKKFRDHRSRAPLVIEQAVGGFTEWYRGTHPNIIEELGRLATEDGYPDPISLSDSMRNKLLLERDQLFECSTAMLDAIEALGSDPAAYALGNALRTRVDAYTAFDLDVSDCLPDEVIAWLNCNGGENALRQCAGFG